MATYKYKMMKNPTKQHLISLGYRYYQSTEDGNELYVYRFPISKYKKQTVIECEVVTELNTGITNINIYEKAYMTYYTLFYQEDLRKQYDDSFLENMENKILSEFKKLGIKQVK
jgi:hypothetical protein